MPAPLKYPRPSAITSLSSFVLLLSLLCWTSCSGSPLRVISIISHHHLSRYQYAFDQLLYGCRRSSSSAVCIRTESCSRAIHCQRSKSGPTAHFSQRKAKSRQPSHLCCKSSTPIPHLPNLLASLTDQPAATGHRERHHIDSLLPHRLHLHLPLHRLHRWCQRSDQDLVRCRRSESHHGLCRSSLHLCRRAPSKERRRPSSRSFGSSNVSPTSSSPHELGHGSSTNDEQRTSLHRFSDGKSSQ